jgi:gas vesicle protein
MSMIGKTFRFVAGFAVGTGIGAVTALLLAPQSGDMSKEQIQARVNEILNAGQRASRKREEELYAAWEAELGTAHSNDGKKDKDGADTSRQLEKARAAAREREDKARDEAQKAQEEAQKKLEKARRELEKAEEIK